MSEKMRVAHMPQVPCKSFYVDVDTVEEGVKIMNTLANYDLFQLENNIKPDYSNMSCLEVFNEEAQEWWSWDIEDPELGFFDVPDEYLEAKNL